MKKEFENELYKIDPIFFEHVVACKEGKEDQMTTCMYFGCECGDGWFEPLKKFAKKTSIFNNLAKEYNIKFVCNQLKEKFGELRVYYGYQPIDDSKPGDKNENVDIISDMLREALKKCEDECWNVCEWCGADGGRDGEKLVTTNGWISRICKKCAKAKAEKEIKHYDEINHQEYVPRITLFKEGYQFLSLYHINGFKCKDSYYHSIIEAFYCEKDKEHKEIYQEIGKRDNDKSSPYLIEKIGNQFAYCCGKIYKYEDNEDDYDLLKDIVKAKFTYKYNENIKKELIETDGKLLQYMGKHHNNILGHCVCDECKNKEYKDLYAKILMEVRDGLK